MLRFFIYVFMCVMLLHSSLYAQERIPAPSQLPHILPLMLTSGFWINRHPSPDSVIMTPEEIVVFNKHVRDELKLTKNIFSVTEDMRVDNLLNELNTQVENFKKKGYYTKNNVRDDEQFIEDTKHNMDISGIVAGVVPRFGLVLRFTDQRFLPTSDPLYEKANDIDFDLLQNSGLDVATPVAVVHKSRDGKWFYVYGPISDGWVRAEDIALGDKEKVLAYAYSKKFAIGIASNADIFSDSQMTKWVGTARMGVRLPLNDISSTRASVRIPSQDAQGQLQILDGYIDSSALHVGYLPLTPRSLYTMAFRWLHAPYGWGDMYGGPDCSRLIQSVYATTGVVLPRDSKDQAQVSPNVIEFQDEIGIKEKLASVSNWHAGNLLTMKGHIMMYLNDIDGVPYAIHASSAYREKGNEYDVVRSLMKVVVTDLSLGEGSRKGSLIKRLNKVVAIEKSITH